MNRFIKRAAALICSAAIALSAVLSSVSSADWVHIGYMGDLNDDKQLNMADLVLMSRHLHGIQPLTNSNSYHVRNTFIGINGADGFEAGEYFVTADVDQNGEVDVFDLIQLRKAVIAGYGLYVWQWQRTDFTKLQVGEHGDFIEAGVNDVLKFMPSQASAKLLIIYADFYNCKYDYLPSTEEIERIAFGEEDTGSSMYPFESASAFYKRSSKGVMELSGKAYHYRAGHSKDHYKKVPGQKELVAEALKALDDTIDYNDFDGNGDGYIDTVLLVVPQKAGKETWWPAAVQYSDNSVSLDGLNIGHMITGFCQIESSDDYLDFTSTILHEMGHCMGLPDYYLYDRTEDFYGMHGTAGSELMDDSGGDFSCVSKLQLGWYRNDQVSVYDPESGTQTFTLYNAQSDKGNTVIIPCGDLSDGYHGECMMIEYASTDGNNSSPPWYVKIGEGIRVYHADMSLYDSGWWTTYRYASGSEFTDNYEGRRLIRIIDDRDVDNTYRSGDVIDGNISGFHWYDASGKATVDTGLVIEVGEKNNDSYTITIRSK